MFKYSYQISIHVELLSDISAVSYLADRTPSLLWIFPTGKLLVNKVVEINPIVL